MSVLCFVVIFSSRRRHTRCALVTGVQTCALPIFAKEYARMEAAKDERQFGTLLDGLTRLGAGNRVHPRWGETMKVISNFLEVGEYNAIAASAIDRKSVV